MPNHTLRTGESLATIARTHGLVDGDSIWSHPANDQLRSKRRLPHLVEPGDVVFVPPMSSRTASVATGRHLPLEVKLPKLRLSLQLQDLRGRPLNRLDCALIGADGQVDIPLTLEGGQLRVELPALHSRSELRLGGVMYVLHAGSLPIGDSPEGKRGAASRLENLGYNPSHFGLEMAIRAFQIDMSLPKTGALDESTTSRLLHEHGS